MISKSTPSSQATGALRLSAEMMLRPAKNNPITRQQTKTCLHLVRGRASLTDSFIARVANSPLIESKHGLDDFALRAVGIETRAAEKVKMQICQIHIFADRNHLRPLYVTGKEFGVVFSRQPVHLR